MAKIKMVSVKTYCEKTGFSRSKVYLDYRLGKIKGKYIDVLKKELYIEME